MEKTGLLIPLEILKEAFDIPFKSHKFLLFTFLIYLPLSLIRLAMDLLTYPQAIEVQSQLLFLHSQGRYSPHVLDIHTKLQENSQKLIKNEVLFLVPIDALTFFGLVAIVHTASVLHMGEKLSLREMFSRLITKASIKGPLLTHICVDLMSFSYIVTATMFGIGASHAIAGKMILILVAYVLPVSMWVFLHAVWNLAMVVSVVEGRHGIGALERGWVVLRGRKFLGFLLMLVSFSSFNCVWELSLEAAKVDNRMRQKAAFSVIFAIFFWFGNAMRWVISLVFYYHCKRQQGEKNEGLGGEQEFGALSPKSPV
ncbi:uncharacterized protein LOC116258999 [Nymphaea colorata]|uniref:uncharacterized protein LOC116258999 n=1 Tax=Nymphaea colorata TaxID=210225 RepID=UPI00129E0512|nr:uncharacterized protein LOC116258999 [Nymphaea colorata]